VNETLFPDEGEATARVVLRFDRGTLLVEGYEGAVAQSDVIDAATRERTGFLWDDRVGHHRALAMGYRDIALALHRQGVEFEDRARAFEPTPFALVKPLEPRGHQTRALEAWLSTGRYGTIVMPTGAGKTIFAVMAIARAARPTLVHVPTIDLMNQWYGVLKSFFGGEIGLLGGGYHDLKPLTVATYDSALLHVTHYGNRFGLHIYDECHHLPGPQTRLVAVQSVAPFRLGLTATPERQDGRHDDYEALCGPVRFEITVGELEGATLAPYEVVTVEVPLSEEELARYKQARECYVSFLRFARVDMSGPAGWSEFLRVAARSPKGREALAAYREQRGIALAAGRKSDLLWDILRRHAGERVLVFTQDNAMAYRLGERFLLPVLTHHTKVREREEMLRLFREGAYGCLVTSKVLNEGVDVPEAAVAVVVSGSGTVREHVQRLGRILRASPGKRAILYELVSADTSERNLNERRKQHSAYQRSPAGAPPVG
jgi:superfamily II DNA or RNA helicase